jgi:hypothetical protein
MGLLEKILEAGKRLLNGDYVSRPEECQFRITNVQGDQEPVKRQKMLKIWRTHPRLSVNNP